MEHKKYPVELSEEEVEMVGARRYYLLQGKRKAIVLYVGLLLGLLIGSAYSVYNTNYLVPFMIWGVLWTGAILYIHRKEYKAGKKYLEGIKSGKDNS